MKKIILKTVIYSSLVIALFSCAKEDALSEKSVVSSSFNKKLGNRTPNKLDKYIQKEFVGPYNIEVQYRLDDIETNFDYNVTPPEYNKAIMIVKMIKYLCLDAYKDNTSPDFLKKYFPKKIVLVGSGAFNDNGTVVLGTAAGGVTILLYRINDIEKRAGESNEDYNARLLGVYFNTIFHEFSHILHQNKKYSTDFEKISDANYVGDEWSKFWKADNPSNKKGFISNYSSKEVNEDFCEIIAHHITLTQGQFDAIITPDPYDATLPLVQPDPTDPTVPFNAPDEETYSGYYIMQKKLPIVKSYLLDSWNINLDDMKADVLNRLDKISSIDFSTL